MDVFPYVELGPVGEGEDEDVLAPGLAGIVETPELRPLIFRVPAVVARAAGDNQLLGPALHLVQPGAADGSVAPVAIPRLTRKVVAQGQSVCVLVSLGGRRVMIKKKQ